MTTEQTAIHWDKDAEGIVTLTLDDPTQSANTMNALFQASLQKVVERLKKEKDAIKGVILTSARKTFFAGGDLKLLIETKPEDAQRLFDEVQALKHHLRTLETLGKPVVAALNGTALGGGLEIALACHRRIAVDEPKSEYGLPEVTLGLLPGGGGVVRVTRMLGLQAALMEVLLQGQRLKAKQAQQTGLIDELVPDSATLLARAREWILANPSSQQSWDRDGYKMPGGTPTTPKLAAMLPAFPANLRKQTKGANYPAPRAIMAAAVEGAGLDFETATKVESRYFVELAVGQVAKNMTQAFFFDLQKINAGASRPKSDAKFAPKKVGILGAGMMGQGIAYVTAKAGISVALKDVSQESAEKGKAYTAKLLEKAVSKGRLDPKKAESTLALIHATAKAEDLAGCDMVIEAVFENRDLKAKVTQEAEKHAVAGVLMCSNTSTLPISGLAQASKNPKQFIGLHFFSPVEKMPLVEIIVGKETSDAALAQAFDYVLAIKKTPIVVNDSRGFFTSRVFGAFVTEGLELLAEGHNPMSIEQAATQAGMPVGPLAVTDEVSLELIRHVREQTKQDLAAEGKPYPGRVAADALVDTMCDELGRKGKAAGAGFYEYPKDEKKHLWPGLCEKFLKAALAAPSPEQFRDMQDRLLYVQSLETVRCLDEKVLRSVADANIGSIFGIGAPPWTGGLLQFINSVGPRAFVNRAQELASRYGSRFEPPASLVALAEKAGQYR
ncbi:MAG: 3-hydroxyacyl-CoA dehydrogenase NAD-binding domain-containing protein [Myxococcaceae bacterium]